MSNIIVGMSGGVDSSVAAAKLLEQGHQVSGLFMKNWEEDDDQEYCAAREDLDDARAVCKLLDIELKTINFSYEYWERVFKLFLEEYRNGRTPNPDVLCNKEIKFKEFLNWAKHLGADFIATGHYARIDSKAATKIEGKGHEYRLKKGCDHNKDQTYFLHTLQQDALRYAYFPIGDMHKTQVREQAKKLSLPTHDKKDSTGICFIGERRFSDFLSRFLPNCEGHIKTLAGETIGRHQGAYYYTIGQRQGLGIGGDGAAWYVADKDVKKNIVYVVQGHDHDALLKKVVLAEQLYWISGQPPTVPTPCKAKTRYRQDEQDCVISMIGKNHSRIEFTHHQWAVTPGQSIVFYQADICLGGGIIQAALEA